MLTVTNMQYQGKDMHPDYDSHYIPITIDGYPISNVETPTFEEYVIKDAKQIVPLYIVGLKEVFNFVVWRDAKITNETNGEMFKAMKEFYRFNIYGSQTTEEAVALLRSKLVGNDAMNGVVVTNGADEGELFVRECRSIRSTLPIVVFCKQKVYHQQWASNIEGPPIMVTSNAQEIFDFITRAFQK